MKRCPHCNINVGGTFDQCPLCQSKLLGDATLDLFPRNDKKGGGMLPVKILAFIFLTGAVITLSLDFLFIKSEHVHFGLIVALWCFAALWYMYSVIRKKRVLAQLILFAVLLISIAAVLTEVIVGYKGFTTTYIVPNLLSLTLISNFILSVLDRSGRLNAMFYLISSVFLGLIPCVVVMIRRQVTPVSWEICFFTSVVVFISLLVFKRREVLNELQKRFHF